MSSPAEVRLLEAFIPPPDFELLNLVGTTYSLNPAVFLAIVSAASFDWTSRGGAVGLDSLTKQEWRELILEKYRRCLMLVDHHGPFEMPSSGLTPLETTSVDQVVKSKGRDTQAGGSLHAKLIVAVYQNSKKSLLGRVYVGSKNFTLSKMSEFGAVYDLHPSTANAGNVAFTHSLTQYLEYLRDAEVGDANENKLVPIRRVIDLVRGARLRVANNSIAFHWQGRIKDKPALYSLATKLNYLLRENWDALFVHSPWTRLVAVRHFSDAMPELPIHISCLKEPGLATLNRKNIKYQLSYSASGHVQPHQSHSKVYFFLRGKESVLAFGSANFTPDGWGISTSNSRQNSEILISTVVDAANYRYLADFSGKQEEISATKTDPTEQERVLEILNGIQVEVEFSNDPTALRYRFTHCEVPTDFDAKVKITHDLIEVSQSDKSPNIAVFSGWPLPPQLDIPWDGNDLFRVSCLIRIRCPAHDVETHLVVDLDDEFYEGRGRLRALQYGANELIESLAQLMNVVLKPVPTPPGDGDGGHAQRLAALLDGLRVERYAFKMSRLKVSEPRTYLQTIARVQKLLVSAREDAQLMSDRRFEKLIQTVEYVHDELDQT